MFEEKRCKETIYLNPLSANSTKWSNTIKQLVDNLPKTCLSVFGHFVKLALKGLESGSYLLLNILQLIAG